MTAATDPVRGIADAVLYGGYVLWPRRRPAPGDDAQRWTFGGVHPRARLGARTVGDGRWTMQTECLVEGDDARVEVAVRFLHLIRRQVLDAAGAPVDELADAGDRHLTREEAIEREVALGPAPLGELSRAGVPRVAPIAIAAGCAREPITAARGVRLGAVVRSWTGLDGTVELRAEALAPALHRVTVRIENVTPWPGGTRAEALRRTLCSTHTVLRVADGAFVSLTDPPPELRAAAAACENAGTWPVLAGPPGARDVLLSSPVVLADHPPRAGGAWGAAADGPRGGRLAGEEGRCAAPR